MKKLFPAAAVLLGGVMLAAQSEVLPQNQTKYPYPAVRDQRGVIPAGP
jgi:hypothetical protein